MRLGIYMIHYFIVGLGYAIADALAIPVFLRIPVTAVIVFCYLLGICFCLLQVCSEIFKWIFG